MTLPEKIRRFLGTRMGRFCVLLLLLTFFYLLDCLASTDKSKPWIETGVEARGFGWTLLFAFAALVYLVVGKKKE